MAQTGLDKARLRIRMGLVGRLRRSPIYPALYPAVWHGWIAGDSRPAVAPGGYFTATPHPGAGIGHQMANWIAGYWFARQFGLRYAHSPFPAPEWERLLGFGAGEVTAEALCAEQGYRRVRLPLFDEDDPVEVARIRRVIRSYGDGRVLFVAEQDQFYRDQIGVIAPLRAKFARAFAAAAPALRFDPRTINVALHMRRGDIAAGHANGNPNLTMRWQDEGYFRNVLDGALRSLPEDRPHHIWLFSQGETRDFADFATLPNLTLCLDMGARESFLHMAKADILITSKSSFSYNPALLSAGLKICPDDFWHAYPGEPDWIVADGSGHFDERALGRRLASRST